jgi:hypothetical protein
MGMVLSMEENEDPWWRTRSRSWECSRSIEDIASGVDCTAAVQQVVWNLCGAIDRLAQAPAQGKPGQNQTRNAGTAQGRCGRTIRQVGGPARGYNMGS